MKITKDYAERSSAVTEKDRYSFPALQPEVLRPITRRFTIRSYIQDSFLCARRCHQQVSTMMSGIYLLCQFGLLQDNVMTYPWKQVAASFRSLIQPSALSTTMRYQREITMHP